MIDKLIGSLLQNIELCVTNIAVRILSKDSDFKDDPVPTILLRVTRIDYQKIDDVLNDYTQELYCLLHEKNVKVGEISVHLM